MTNSSQLPSPSSTLALKARRLADLFDLKEPTVWNWRRYGDLPCLEIGGAIRFDPGEVLAWIKGGGPARANERRRQVLAERTKNPDTPRHPGGRPRSGRSHCEP